MLSSIVSSSVHFVSLFRLKVLQAKNLISYFLKLYFKKNFFTLTLESLLHCASCYRECKDGNEVEIVLKKVQLFILFIAIMMMDICSITHLHGVHLQCNDSTFVILSRNNKTSHAFCTRCSNITLLIVINNFKSIF